MSKLTFSRLSCLIFVLAQKNSHAESERPHGAFLYEDLRCTTKDGNSYECNNVAAKDHCIFEGKRFEIGEEINDPSLPKACMDNCTCLEGGSIRCDENFCDNIGFAPLECEYKYPIDSCCPVRTCEPLKMNCTVDGKTEMEGALFFPDNTCFICFCYEGFSDKFEAPYCRKRRCYEQLSNMTNLANKCAPLYIFRDCCPAEWICNEKQKIVKLSQDDSKSELFCDFGEDKVPYGYGFETVVKSKFDTIRAKCECNLPPFMTCLDIPGQKN